jgi:hypothetical protein
MGVVDLSVVLVYFLSCDVLVICVVLLRLAAS